MVFRAGIDDFKGVMSRLVYLADMMSIRRLYWRQSVRPECERMRMPS